MLEIGVEHVQLLGEHVDPHDDPVDGVAGG
jgi:hypothetical protein